MTSVATATALDVLKVVGVVLVALGGLAGGVAAIYTALRARQFEALRAQLQAEGVEHEIRFARLHERRVVVVERLYKRLVRAERLISSWMHPLQEAGQPPPQEKAAAALAAANEFRTTFLENRIWLDEGLCDRISVFDQTVGRAIIEFTTYRPDDPMVRKEHFDSWVNAWNKVSKDLPAIRQEIEREFRTLLGIAAGAAEPSRLASQPTTPREERNDSR